MVSESIVCVSTLKFLINADYRLVTKPNFRIAIAILYFIIRKFNFEKCIA